MTTTVTLAYRGAPQTVAFVKRGALEAQTKPILRFFVEQITKDLLNKDTVSESLAIYYFTVNRTRYLRDPRTVELVRAPWIILEQIRRGHTPGIDCDDSACLIAAMCLAAGAEVRVATVAFDHAFHRGERQYSHIFCQAREPRTGRWLTLDPVAGDRIREMRGRVVAVKFWPIA